ncbi:tetratricopeptide repeat protein [Intrasporangium sp. YIM S08009]|uniref:tetratricopeptide repeat protein n=1 Tax=Intrasporangium zincisolvens TaxID=3080018 RepID=UPI002B05E965|nr:tetratricopeptide repeat protein [Intrasporangium sp. YIM S08009]
MPEAELTRIRALLDLKRPAEAEERARVLLTKNPDSDAVLRVLAVALNKQGRCSEARQTAARAVRAQPDEPMNHILMSGLHASAGDMASALQAADEAVRLAPQHWQSYFARADVLRHGTTSECQRALSDAVQAVKLAPQSADMHNLVGLCLGRLGRPEQQRKAYLQALRLDPNHAPAQNNLAALDMEQGRLGAARRELLSALAGSPNSDVLLRNHALLVARVLTGAWVAVAMVAGIEAILLLAGAGVALRSAIAVALVTTVLTVASRVLGGPSRAMRTLPAMLGRSVRRRLVLALGWVAVLAAVLVLAVRVGGGSADGRIVAWVSVGLVSTLTVLVMTVQPREP